MAGGKFFALLDDITKMTSLAARKTSGVVGDDLALNAQYVSGIAPERELPVVLKIAGLSAVSKVGLTAGLMAISALAPAAVITGMMVLGGAYLCYEGAEKVLHKFMHAKHDDHTEHGEAGHAAPPTKEELTKIEKKVVRNAAATDVVLSAEIMILTLGVAKEAVPTGTPFVEMLMMQGGTLTVVGAAMTVGVYGLVAAIVKIDDVGLSMSNSKQKGPLGSAVRGIGGLILGMAPWMMKGLSLAGTVAMFTVGGEILSHNLPHGHDLIHSLEHAAAHIPAVGGAASWVAPLVMNGLGGVLAGVAAVGTIKAGGFAMSKGLEVVRTVMPGLKKNVAPEAAGAAPGYEPKPSAAPAVASTPAAPVSMLASPSGAATPPSPSAEMARVGAVTVLQEETAAVPSAPPLASPGGGSPSPRP